MGNCMIKTSGTPAVLDEAQEGREAADESTARGYDADTDCEPEKRPVPSPGAKRGRLKLKVVLTKAELEWLMLRVKEEKGSGSGVVEGAALEQALERIRKGRKRDGVGEKQACRPWRPSLDRIVELPETH